MSMLLIINPGSRAGRSAHRHEFWCAELRRRGVSFEIIRTVGPGHAREVARTQTGHDMVVAVGGDGTINEVLDGLLLSARVELTMGVLYAGTSPDFCRFHGIPTEPNAALEVLLAGQVCAVDAVRIEYRGEDGEPLTGHFGCSCSVGMGAAVASVSNRLRPRLGDALGTGAAVLRALATQPPVDLQLTVDDDRVELPRTNHLMVLKNPHIASGLRLDLGLETADGRLCVVAVHGRSPLGLLRLLPGFYSGRAAEAEGVFSRLCERVTIRAEGRADIEFDGDPHGRLHAEVSILPGALRLQCATSRRAK
ncbi:hypothetical protein HQ520_05210 [bacterium]|nr:hypothetical protein [bacterium]